MVFVLDHSGSITDNNPKNGSWDNWVLMKDFVKSIISSRKISADGTRVAVVTFGNSAQVVFPLNKFTDAASATNAVSSIPLAKENTDLYLGLNVARTQVLNAARPNVPKIIIVLTDGVATREVEKTIPEANACHQDGIKVFTIGITNIIDENQLKMVSSPPQQKGVTYWTLPDYTTLSSIINNVEAGTCLP